MACYRQKRILFIVLNADELGLIVLLIVTSPA